MRRMDQIVTTPEKSDNAVPNVAGDTIVFKRSHFYAIMVVFAFAVGVLVGYMAWGRGGLPAQQASDVSAQVAATQAANPSYTRYDVPIDGYPSLGPDDAEITLVEFSDFQCPYCKRWEDEVYKPLFAAYPGQIRLVYRNLPLTSIHPQAMSAAIASLCAKDQGAYWPYHENQSSLGAELYVQVAKDLGLDVTSFQACLDSGKFDDYIKQDMDFSLNLGVRSTPTFFINGLAVVGAQPIDVFKQVIDKELAGEIPQ